VHPGQGESFTSDLQGEIVVVGRSSDADLQVDDKYLSRKHANLIFRDGGWWIEDLGSRNGTKLNGSFVEEPTRLTAGDELRLCQSSIIFDADAAPAQPLVPSTDRAEPHTMFLSASELTRLGSPQLTASLDSVEELRRQAEKLHLLNDIHRVLDQSMELEGVLDLILDRAFETLSPGEALIFLKQTDGSYRRVAQRSAGNVDADHLYSETLIREVAEKGMAALVMDTGIDPKMEDAKSILGLGVLSLVAAPLLDASGSLGMIALTSTLSTGTFNEDDLELLVSLASIAAMRIRNVALAEKAAEEAAARGRLEEELNLARQIQEALLPSGLPDVEGYELCGGNVPSRGVSGDYYTVVERNGGDEFVLMVADVSGKGMAASLLTFSLEALAAGPIDNGQPADEICSRVCRRLYKRTLPAKYATLFLAVLDPRAHTLSFCNAGHNSGLLLSAKGGVQQLRSSGPPVGLMPEGIYKEQTVEMAPEDLLVLYTDGITEASDPDDEEYGIDRLAKICKLRRQDDLDLLSEAIQRDLDTFTRGVPYADDRTLLLIRRA
jgi:serine phosphatase RsbU (regulator of sigma subunit)